jgi:membrane protein required for colicin V production
MLIDLIFLSMMVMAIYKGFKNGLIVAVFSIAAWILGLMAAFRFSDAAAEYLKVYIDVSPRILSIISFILVFSVVMMVINLGAKLVEKTVELSMLGWVNRLGGIFFYVLLYVLIFSVLIYFAERVKLLNEETISSSRVYPWVKPLAEIIRKPLLQ